VNDAFKELEVAGWREPGRGDAYDAVVGRVTARVAEPLLDAVGVSTGTSLLDVATGTGHVAAAAAARGAHAVGIDISEEMLARARARYDGVEFALGDADELAFTTRSTRWRVSPSSFRSRSDLRSSCRSIRSP